MANFILDSYALLAFFRSEPGGEQVEKLLNEAAEEKHHLFMSVINAGEVYYMAARKDGPDKAEIVWKALHQFPVTIVDVDMLLTYKAASIKAKYRLNFADSYAAALAISKKAILLTGDKEFEHLEQESGFKIRWL